MIKSIKDPINISNEFVYHEPFSIFKPLALNNQAETRQGTELLLYMSELRNCFSAALVS